MFTQDRLQELFAYDPLIGIFTHKQSRPGVRPSKKIAGALNSDGYRYISVDCKSYKAHHMVFMYLFGRGIESGLMVDHINRNRDDNRLENLRIVTSQENNRNLELSERNTSGFTGVTWHKKNSCWCAQTVVNKKCIYLGSFKEKEEAIAARKQANIDYGFHENHGEKLNTKGGA